MIIMDDIHYLLSNSSATKFATRLSRIIRHYGSSFITSNKNSSDYFKNPCYLNIFENSNWKIFLKSSPSSITEICENLKYLSTSIKPQEIIPKLSKFNKKQALIHNMFEGWSWTEFDFLDYLISK